MPVSERLLHFIWQFQYFNKSELVTHKGDPLQVIFPGQYNSNQGPDFSNAKILIGNTTWAGTIELHIKTSDWDKHGHQEDSNYNNVILHVVWEDDSPLSPVKNKPRESLQEKTEARPEIPLIELRTRVPKILLQRYEELMQSASFMPCEKRIHLVHELTWNSWKERLMAERLLRKAKLVETFLKQTNYHWEETFWWMLARNFGMKVNGDAFEAVARSVPLSLLSRHKNQIHQLEALLLGQGGLLNGDFEEDYPRLLQREYRFLRKKYQLQPIRLPLFSLRMRPQNFPAVRLAELAMLVKDSIHLFSKIKEMDSAKEIRRFFEVTANDYWHYHYRFDGPSGYKEKKTGASMIDNIIINTVAPLLFAYGTYYRDGSCKEKAVRCLEALAGERNPVTIRFRQLKVEIKNARDSQALIELSNEYCNKKRCLECAAGNAILKQD